MIPDRTSLRFLVRAGTLDRLETVEQRVRDCFQAGAMATGCQVTVTHPSPTYSHFEGDHDLEALYGQNLVGLGTQPQPAGDAQYSTDMSNVSLAIPTVHPTVGIASGDAVNHQAEFAAHCVEPSADEALIRGAAAMAWTCIDAATDQEVRRRLLAGERKRAHR